MSAAPTWEEMEEKRQDVSVQTQSFCLLQHTTSHFSTCPAATPLPLNPLTSRQMISSFKDIASAMTRCVSIIEDYARLSPSSLPNGPTPRKISSVPLPSDDSKKPRSKREKKIKDPNAPKRPPSAYILFQNEVREEMRNANPGLPYKDVLGLISSKWKDLPEEQKKVGQRVGGVVSDGAQVYEGAYTDASATYRMDEAAYNKDGGHAPVGDIAEHCCNILSQDRLCSLHCMLRLPPCRVKATVTTQATTRTILPYVLPYPHVHPCAR